MNPQHIETIINSLVDKYTMRSKAYKNVTKNFLLTTIEMSQSKLNKLNSEPKIYKYIMRYLKSKNLINEGVPLVDS